MDSIKNLGTAIQKARINRGISQEKLAEAMDVTPTHIRHIESGHRKPSVELLFALAKYLDISLDSIVFNQNNIIPVIHTDGLSEEEAGTLAHLADLIRQR